MNDKHTSTHTHTQSQKHTHLHVKKDLILSRALFLQGSELKEKRDSVFDRTEEAVGGPESVFMCVFLHLSRCEAVQPPCSNLGCA